MAAPFRLLNQQEKLAAHSHFWPRNFQYVVVEPIIFYVRDGNGQQHEVAVQPGFLSDGCTYSPDARIIECIKHDWLYENHCAQDGYLVTFDQANGVLNRSRLLVVGLLLRPFTKRWWDQAGRRGPAYYTNLHLPR
jgi:hypothetical protein